MIHQPVIKHWTSYALILIVLIIISLACNAPDVLSGSYATATFAKTPPFLEITVTPRDAGKIVIMNVDTDNNMKISKISLLLPQQLMGAEIYANDYKIDATSAGEKGIELDLTGKVNAREVTLIFKTEDQQLAACTIKVSDPLNPVGDCGW